MVPVKTTVMPDPTAMNSQVLRYHGVVEFVDGGGSGELLLTNVAQPEAEGLIPEGSPLHAAGQQEKPVVIWVAKLRRSYSPKIISKPIDPFGCRLKDSGLLDFIGIEYSQVHVPGPPKFVNVPAPVPFGYWSG